MNELDDQLVPPAAATTPPLFGRRSWLWYPTVMIVAVVLFACAAPWIGMGDTMFLAIYLYLATTAVLIAIGIAVFGARPLRVIAVIACTLPGVWLLFYVETLALRELLFHFRPPRPMFHNQFALHERALLPLWRVPRPLGDRIGHRAWADWDDNVLVVIASARPDHSYAQIEPGRQETGFKLGDKGKERVVTVQRTRDALIVILPRGEMQSFQLCPDVARNWETDRKHHPPENLLRGAAALMTPGQDEKWNSFLAGYVEPPPKTGSTPTSTPATPGSP